MFILSCTLPPPFSLSLPLIQSSDIAKTFHASSLREFSSFVVLERGSTVYANNSLAERKLSLNRVLYFEYELVERANWICSKKKENFDDRYTWYFRKSENIFAQPICSLSYGMNIGTRAAPSVLETSNVHVKKERGNLENDRSTRNKRRTLTLSRIFSISIHGSIDRRGKKRPIQFSTASRRERNSMNFVAKPHNAKHLGALWFRATHAQYSKIALQASL